MGAPVPIRRRVRRRMKNRAAHSSSRGASPAPWVGACADPTGRNLCTPFEAVAHL